MKIRIRNVVLHHIASDKVKPKIFFNFGSTTLASSSSRTVADKNVETGVIYYRAPEVFEVDNFQPTTAVEVCFGNGYGSMTQ